MGLGFRPQPITSLPFIGPCKPAGSRLMCVYVSLCVCAPFIGPLRLRGPVLSSTLPSLVQHRKPYTFGLGLNFIAPATSLPPPSNVYIRTAGCDPNPPPPAAETPTAPLASARHFRRRAPTALRRPPADARADNQPPLASDTSAEQGRYHADGNFDV